MLARKRAIAAMMSSVERGFFGALAVVAVVLAVRFKPVAKPLVALARTDELVAFKVFALVLVLVVVVVVVVVVVFIVRGLYIEANAFGRAAVLIALVVVAAGRLALVKLDAVERDANNDEPVVLRLAAVNEDVLGRVTVVLGRATVALGREATAIVDFNSGIVSETGVVTIPGSRGAS